MIGSDGPPRQRNRSRSRGDADDRLIQTDLDLMGTYCLPRFS